MQGSSSGDERPPDEPPKQTRRGREKPEYTVYRSRPRLRDRLRKPDVASLRQRAGGERPSLLDRLRRRGGEAPAAPAAERPWYRRALKWLGILALAWIVLSFLAFAISAQLQEWKLADSAKQPLDGNPFLLASPQTVLVLGTDIRSGAFAGPEEAASKRCLEAAGEGHEPPSACDPYRSDTLLLVRAGRGTLRKLSIPRDVLAEIPGHGAEKINSAYALGGAKLTELTVEDFLGIDIDQVAIVDFDGFRRFIDAIGGIEVDLPTPVCSSVSSGAFNLDLEAGENTLDGFEAITLARTRENTCSTGEFAGQGDLERVQFQQLILDGIKGRLTDPLRLPYNFIRGPIIGWTAPQAIVSSMGAFNMPQLVLAAAVGGGGGTEILIPTSLAANPLVIAQEECERKIRDFLGSAPPRTPACSPGG